MRDLVRGQSDNIPTDDVIKELMEENLFDNSFKLLVLSYKINDFTSSLTKFEESKLQIMIDIHYFGFTEARYIELRNISYELAERFALANQSEFLEIIEECDLGVDEIKAYLRNDNFSVNERLKIIKCISSDEVDEELAQQIRNFKVNLPKEYVEVAWDI